jgi:hypothetical protein
MALAGTIAAVVAALAALATVLYARRTVLDGRDAHRTLMADRQRAHDAEVALQRLVQAERLIDALTAMARTAHEETVKPPMVIDGNRWTFIPTSQAQLRAEIAVFYALGGPKLSEADDLGQMTYSMTTQPAEVTKLARNSLGELMRLAGKDARLRREPAVAKPAVVGRSKLRSTWLQWRRAFLPGGRIRRRAKRAIPGDLDG